MGYLHSLGEVASTALGVYIIARAVWAVFKILANSYHLYHSHGCTATLFMACCVDIFHSYQYRKSRISEREREKENERDDLSPTTQPPTKVSWWKRYKHKTVLSEKELQPLNAQKTNNLCSAPLPEDGRNSSKTALEGLAEAIQDNLAPAASLGCNPPVRR